jgi:C4-dicarboxylate-specific signal transduction histidine kinase
MRSISSSDASSDIYGIRYHAARAAAPSLDSIEKLIQLENAIQGEISSQLSAVSVALDKDIEVTKKCILFNEPCKKLSGILPSNLSLNTANSQSEPYSAIINHLEAVWQSHQQEHERSIILKAKAKAIRERYTTTTRKLSVIHERAGREVQRVDEKKAALAKADKALNEAGRLIVKAEMSEKVGVRMVDSPQRINGRPDSGFRLDSDGCCSE